MGCLIMPFKAIWFFVTWLFEKLRFWAIPVLITIVIIGAVFVKQATKPHTPIPTTEPTIQQAPFLVTTPSRYYYAVKTEKVGKNIVLKGYWTLQNKKWIYHDKLVLTPAYGEPKIERRK